MSLTVVTEAVIIVEGGDTLVTMGEEGSMGPQQVSVVVVAIDRLWLVESI